MDHTRDATKLLVEHMTRGGFAFAFVSDPYTCADRIPNVPPTITIFHAPARPRVMLLARAPGFDFFPLYLSQLVVAVSCEGPGQSFILVATYAPPHRPLDPILDELAQCFSRFPSRAFILAGDFNAKHPLWGPAPSDARGVQLVQFACANELRVLNSPDSPPTFDTPYASSWIDVSLASLSLTRAGFAWSVSDSDTLSDHRYLEFSFSGMPGVRKKRLTNFARAQILDSLDRSVWFDRVVGCRFSSCMPLTSSWRNFIVFTMPFTHATYARSSRVLLQATPGGRHNWPLSGRGAQYARTFASYKRNIRHAKDTFDRSLCQELTTRNLFGDPFKLAFAKLSPPTHLPPLFQTDGNLTSSVLSSAALLLRVHVGADDPAEDTEFHRRVRCVVDAPYPRTADDFPFSLTEVEHAVSLGNPRAAPGLDGLTAAFIRNLFRLKPQFFLRIFNAALALGHFPSCWKAGRIIFITKPGRPLDQPSAYRPIVMNSLFGKILERLLNSRLYYFLCSRNLIHPRQFGFTHARSAPLAMYALRQRLFSLKTAKTPAVLISLDFTGAFDSVWHAAVLFFLRKHHCPANLYHLLRSFLSGRRVVYRSSAGEVSACPSIGSPQGSPISPLLWNIIIHSLLDLDFPPGHLALRRSRLDSVFLLSSGDTFLVPRVGPATYTCQLLKPLPCFSFSLMQ
ncbi:hypothetical protein HPB49_017427 [Dermacentor silvarum]|uniref:Uncharacterized protein n=1 Tax=Dermacentor silvarum TaxID=543639 RepID=A0ACB8C4N6_DERSI|nr:hypothetical protein HPB49_017427 [Dermacentor silvarum]